jgi:DnaJ-class molecular chaperone
MAMKKCKDCGGRGKIITEDNSGKEVDIQTCDTCRGTGMAPDTD